MKKLMLLVVIAFALPACGKKTPPPANATDMKKDPAAGDPCAKPADPCAKPADPCAGNPCAPK